MSLEEVVAGIQSAIDLCDEIIGQINASKRDLTENASHVAAANEEHLQTATGLRGTVPTLEELRNTLRFVFSTQHTVGDQAISLTVGVIESVETELEEVTRVAEVLDSMIAQLAAIRDQVELGGGIIAGVQEDLKNYLGVIAS